MKTLIIYDSAFGNTEEIAEAIQKAMGKDATIKKVADTKSTEISEYELIIIGSPTQAFRPLPSIMTFLNQIAPDGLNGKKVAAFDTRIAVADVKSKFLGTMVKFFGYAAKPIADTLEKKGGTLIAPPEGFLVKDKEGPLKEGELDRAAEWAKGLIGQ